MGVKYLSSIAGVLACNLELLTLLDLCVSSLRRGRANLLCIVPIQRMIPEGNPSPPAFVSPSNHVNVKVLMIYI